MKAVPAAEAARNLLGLCRPFAHDLGCAEELEGINDIIDHGTGASRQVEVFRRTNDPREVVKFLIAQLEADASIRPTDRESPPAALA
jgi:carboxylate-amine ligase